MASSLPPEIWFVIVEYLPRRDQLRVSQVSPQFCAVARKIVYCNVELRSDYFAVGATLALLAGDHSLARNVKRLHIYTAAYTRQEPTWFDTDALAGMRNLCELELTGMPFHTEEDQLKFTNTVSESLPALRKLEYRARYSGINRFRRPEIPVLVLQIGGLQKIRWIDANTFIHPLHILTPLNASRETLTDIRISVPTGCPVSCEPFIQFFTLCFPCLSTLRLGGWDTTMAPVGVALTSFLVAHPLIKDLHLDFSGPYGKAMHCRVDPDLSLDSGTLPNLSRLSADACNLGIFLRGGILSLQTLESLYTGERHKRDSEFAVMHKALEAYGGLPGLKTLRLELGGFHDDLEITRWVTGFGELCPKVERFMGGYEIARAATNQDIFASYRNLKSKIIPDPGIDDDW